MENSDHVGGFDVERLAELVVRDLQVGSGQMLGIWASTHSLDLIEALAYHIRERGAFWTLRLTIESLLERIGKDLPEVHLANVPQHELRWLGDLDAIIEVHDHAGHIPGVTPQRRRAMAAEWIALIDEAERLGLRRLKILYPTQALARAYGLDLDEFFALVETALKVDPDVLQTAQFNLKERLSQVDEVRLTSPLGVDLRLSISGRPVFTDNQDLPRGEVYLAPHEDSAEGLVVVDLAFIRGRRIERLALRFEAGRVVEISARDAQGVQALHEVFAVSSGDADRIGEFAIGLNPNLDKPVGIAALDEKIGGSAHIALGMNTHFGGANRSNLHLDLVMLHVQIWLDGEQLKID